MRAAKKIDYIVIYYYCDKEIVPSETIRFSDGIDSITIQQVKQNDT